MPNPFNVVKVRPNGTSCVATIPAFIVKALNLSINDSLAVSFNEETRVISFRAVTEEEVIELAKGQFQE